MKKACEMSAREQARYIDHSVLKPEFTQNEIVEHIVEGIRYGCKTVCVNPAAANIAREMCADTDTGICVVCDFPFGKSGTASKVLQARSILKAGKIDDLDLVADYGLIRSGMWDDIAVEISLVAAMCRDYDAVLKVIFETDALTYDQIAKATDVACKSGADFVKTSTGFFTGGKNDGATPEVIKVMMDAAAGRCKIKGAGGIRTREAFLRLIDMGIDRMGIGYKSTPIVLGL